MGYRRNLMRDDNFFYRVLKDGENHATLQMSINSSDDEVNARLLQMTGMGNINVPEAKLAAEELIQKINDGQIIVPLREILEYQEVAREVISRSDDQKRTPQRLSVVDPLDREKLEIAKNIVKQITKLDLSKITAEILDAYDSVGPEETLGSMAC